MTYPVICTNLIEGFSILAPGCELAANVRDAEGARITVRSGVTRLGDGRPGQPTALRELDSLPLRTCCSPLGEGHVGQTSSRKVAVAVAPTGRIVAPSEKGPSYVLHINWPYNAPKRWIWLRRCVDRRL